MSAQSSKDEAAGSGADFTPRQIAILKVAVLVMGVIFIVGFATLIGTIFYQSTQLAGSSTQKAKAPVGSEPVSAFDVAIGADQTVESVTLDGNRIALHLNGPKGREIAVVDLVQGKVISRVRLKPE